MFPGLVGRVQHLDQQMHNNLFDIIRQAISRWLEHEQGHLPPTYAAELHRTTNATGTRSFTTYTIHRQHLPDVCDDIMTALHDLPWGEGAFFLHEIRGMRGATVHNPRDEDLRQESLDLFTDVFVEGTFDDANQQDLADGLAALPLWYIDVAMEYRLQEHVLHLRKDYHRHLIRHFLECTEQQLDRLMAPNSTRYQSDAVAQLEEFAGFRCNPRTLGHEMGIVHFNVYTTDKSLTYHRTDDGRVSKFITARQVLSAPKDGYLKEIEKMYGTLRLAASADPPVEGHVRVEIRVKFERATMVLISLPDNLWGSMMIAHLCQEWW
jgi:hypothetical protein